jgi:hypothetical protein
MASSTAIRFVPGHEDAAAPATTPTYEVGGAAGAETAGLEAPEVGI